jgi:hypothetical protein
MHRYINSLVRHSYKDVEDEETLRSYVSSVFIEANRKGIRYSRNKVEEPKVEEVKQEETNEQGIEINMPNVQKVQELPLVVKLPSDASNAQIAYAKVINAYAYQNPRKFAMKKDAMVKTLLSLKNAPDPIVGNLKINNSGL